MADLALAERSPLANRVASGRHGRTDGDPGVSLRVLDGRSLTFLMAHATTGPALRQAASGAGIELPAAGRIATVGGVTVLWAGPEQWLVVGDPNARAAAERLVAACRPFCTAVDQSDARAVVSVAGPQARACLAKGVAIDLHPRVFGVGATALTPAAGVAAQIWQTDPAPTFRLAIPRSYAEGFWAWLTEAAAEYGVFVEENPA